MMDYDEFLLTSSKDAHTPVDKHERDCFQHMDSMLAVPPNVFSRPSRNPDRDSIDQTMVLGDGEAKDRAPLSFKTPFFVSAVPLGYVPKWTRQALAMGLSQEGIPVFTREGTFDEEKQLVKEFNGSLVATWEPSRLGTDIEYFRAAQAIEITLSGPANPVQGTAYPKEILDARTASEKRVPADRGFIAPSAHHDMASPNDLKKHVHLVREVTGHRVPIILHLEGGDLFEEVKFAVECGADAIRVSAGCAPRSGAPSGFGASAGLPLPALLGPVKRAFESSRVPAEKVKVLVSGNVRDGNDVFKLVALGAGAVDISIPVMRLLSLIAVEPKPDYKKAAARVSALVRSFREQMEFMMAYTGAAKLADVTQECLRASTYDCACLTGLKIAGYNGQPPLWMY